MATERELYAVVGGRKNRPEAEAIASYGGVPAEKCSAWRRRRGTGERPAEIAEGTEWSRNTVSRHANGRCRHGGGEQ